MGSMYFGVRYLWSEVTNFEAIHTMMRRTPSRVMPTGNVFMPWVVSSGALLMHGDGGVLCSSATIPWAEAKEMANSKWGIIRKSARRVDVLFNIVNAINGGVQLRRAPCT